MVKLDLSFEIAEIKRQKVRFYQVLPAGVLHLLRQSQHLSASPLVLYGHLRTSRGLLRLLHLHLGFRRPSCCPFRCPLGPPAVGLNALLFGLRLSDFVLSRFDEWGRIAK